MSLVWKQPRRPAFKGRDKRVLIFSDIHIPNHDPKAVATLFEFAKDFKPDQVVINGDFMDLAGISRHADASTANRLKGEFAQANDFLDALRKVVGGGSVIDLNGGNHDERFEAFIERDAPQLTGLTSFEAELRLKQRKISFMPYHGDNIRFLSDKLATTHGAAFGSHYTKATLDKYGVSIIVGHAHRPQMTTVPTVGPTGPQVRACWGLGCLVAPTHVRYMRAPSGWTQGWGVALIRPTGEFNVHHVNLTRGKVNWFNGKTYG